MSNNENLEGLRDALLLLAYKQLKNEIDDDKINDFITQHTKYVNDKMQRYQYNNNRYLESFYSNLIITEKINSELLYIIKNLSYESVIYEIKNWDYDDFVHKSPEEILYKN